MSPLSEMITKTRSVRALISLLKSNNIKKCVLCHGSKNMGIVLSLQNDPYFHKVSAVDEREAIYLAIGIAKATDSPVLITCTSGQASRNFIAGMSNAYANNIPLIVCTADYHQVFHDCDFPQVIESKQVPTNTTVNTYDIPIVESKMDNSALICMLNKGFSEMLLTNKPVHFNFRFDKHWEPTNQPISKVRNIEVVVGDSSLIKQIKPHQKVLFVIGQGNWSTEEISSINALLYNTNSFAYTFNISNFHSSKSLNGSRILICQRPSVLKPDLIITIGSLSGDYFIQSFLENKNIEHWHLGCNGHFNDKYNSNHKHIIGDLTDLSRDLEFKQENCPEELNNYFNSWKSIYDNIKMPPKSCLSHYSIASLLHNKIPANSSIHLSILSSYRNWDLFPLPETVRAFCNVAAFGIDGCLSTFLGHSRFNPFDSFLIIGDLSFFYDMSILTGCTLSKNVNIVLVNNRGGAEFRMFSNAADKYFGGEADKFVAASNHNSSSVKEFVTSIGFNYFPCDSINLLDKKLLAFLADNENPSFLEVFTDIKGDSNVLEELVNLNRQEISIKVKLKSRISSTAKKLIPQAFIEAIKNQRKRDF